MGSNLLTKLNFLKPDYRVVLSGFLFFFARPFFPQGWVFAPLIFIPFLIQQNRSTTFSQRLIGALWLQFLCALALFDWMIPAAQVLWNKDLWVVLLVYALLSPFFLVPIPVVSFTRYFILKSGRSLMFAGVLSALLYPLLEFYFSYMYLSIADGLLGRPELASLARFGGAPLLSFLLVFHMELFSAIWVTNRTRALTFSASYLVVFFALSLWVSSLGVVSPENTEKFIVNLIQTNSTRLEALDGVKPAHLRTYSGQIKLLNLVREARKNYPGPQLTIIPETIFSYDFFGATDMRAVNLKRTLENEILMTGGDFLFGAVTTSSTKLLENSAIHARVSKGKVSYTKYPKRYLMPFSEELPGVDSFPWLEKIFFKSVLASGENAPIILTVGNFRFGVIICNEVFHPGLVALHGTPDAIIHMGNETWVTDTSGQSIILAKGAVRAIENNTPILKVANSGYSALINPNGVLEFKIPALVEKVTSLALEKRSPEMTPYQRYPGLILWVLSLSSVLLFILGSRRNFFQANE